MAAYIDELERLFEVELIDVPSIAEMPYSVKSENDRHTFLLDRGIDHSAKWLKQQIEEPSNILAFSVGGTIAWKAALRGAPMKKMLLVSSTRIRKEIERPDSEIKLVFGERDAYKPTDTWLQSMKLSQIEIPNEGHLVYQKWDLIKEEVLNFL